MIHHKLLLFAMGKDPSNMRSRSVTLFTFTWLVNSIIIQGFTNRFGKRRLLICSQNIPQHILHYLWRLWVMVATSRPVKLVFEVGFFFVQNKTKNIRRCLRPLRGYVVIYLSWAHVLCGKVCIRNAYQEVMCYDKSILCDQNMLTLVRSFSTVWRAYVSI
jgi:hypothetical protein